MSVAEMKKAIYEKVDKLSSQDQLDVVLEVLNKFEAKECTPIDIDSIFEKAASRYGNTLQKLAQ
jgi:hypothetical protein